MDEMLPSFCEARSKGDRQLACSMIKPVHGI
jgi:hypothetical protein